MYSRRQHYQKAIEEINDLIFKMGISVEEALKSSVKALINSDETLAKTIIAGDEAINRMEHEIENKCIMLIATEAPVAADLRQVITILRIVSDIERIGDHAAHLAKSVCYICNTNITLDVSDFKIMAELGILMFHDAINCFMERDAQLAVKIAARDNEIDLKHKEMMKKIKMMIQEHSDQVEQYTTLMIISRYIERLGDHVTNICEGIVYSVTNEHVDLNQ